MHALAAPLSLALEGSFGHIIRRRQSHPLDGVNGAETLQSAFRTPVFHIIGLQLSRKRQNVVFLFFLISINENKCDVRKMYILNGKITIIINSALSVG